MELQDRHRSPSIPSPLCKAIRDGSEEEMRCLLDAVLTPKEINEYDENGLNALHYAVKFNRLSIMDTLYEKGADIDFPTEHYPRLTPMHLAAKHNAVEMIEFLIDKGADKEIQTSDGYTPLLTAVAHGQKRAMNILVNQGCATEVKNRENESITVLFIAAEENRSQLLKDMICHQTKALDFHSLLHSPCSSRNVPLHVACAKGNIACVKILLDSGVTLDSRNNSRKTPLHLAAENGHVHIVNELLRHGNLSSACFIEVEDDTFNTPLLLACESGHYSVARVLLEAKADPNVRNARHLTPLYFAATYGYHKIVQLLIEYKAEVDCKDKKNWTPLMKACHSGHAKAADTLIHNKASVSVRDEDRRNVLDIAIDEEHEDVAMIIAKSGKIEDALRNTSKDEDGNETTPMRKLIMKMPDVTEEVFKHFLDKEKNEQGTVMEKFNYEFLDDFSFAEQKGEYEELDEDWRPKTYKRSNHCLHILANSDKSSRLLKHPLVTSLLEYKWITYGLWINLLFLSIYLIYIIFLTAFALTALPPGTATCIKVRNGNTSSEICKIDASESRLLFVAIAGGIVIIFSFIGLLIEAIQLIKLGLVYFRDWSNYMEILLFIFSIIFVFVFKTNCFCPTPWQWQIGAITLFMGWLDLVKYTKKLPFVGVYPFMFLNISYDFLKMTFLAAFLILSFSFSFYMLFYDPTLSTNDNMHTPFDNPWRTIVKTMTMTTGEFEFDSTFHQDREEYNSSAANPYLIASYLLWILFIIMMPILLTNLLVGLAVDAYTKGIKDNAELRSLVLKINLILSVEEFLPRSIRHRLIKLKREIKHKNFLGWKKLDIKRTAYIQFEHACKADTLKKTESEDLPDKVNKMESQLENMSHQNTKMMKMMESMAVTLNLLERRFNIGQPLHRGKTLA